MSRPPPPTKAGRRPPTTAARLAAAAAAYQADSVIPHCPACTSPCCRLDKLVLDLDWPQVRTLWRIDQPRQSFDRQLASSGEPVEIRAANGRYYVHSKPCPAYLGPRGCSIYDQPLKPTGCTDFPVYEDAGAVIADLRCEAVDLDALRQRLTEAVGPDLSIRERADREFPFLIELSTTPTGRR